MSIYLGLNTKQYKTNTNPIAGGGEGYIFEIIGEKDYVVKIYHEKKRTSVRMQKILAMLKSPPEERAKKNFLWPIDIVFENKKFAGFVMPRLENKRKLNEIYLHESRKGVPWKLYIAIAKNLSVAIDSVHQTGHICGDLNPNNIFVNPDNGIITLIDTDSYHIKDRNDGRIYRCEVAMAEFVPKELQGLHFGSAPLPTFTKETDYFSLSLLIFSLLMNGSHPFACSVSLSVSSSTSFQPIDNITKGIFPFMMQNTKGIGIPKYAPSIDILGDGMKQLFYRAFIDGHINCKKRPGPREWFFELNKLEKLIKICNRDKAHYYYSKLPYCPWCKLDNTTIISQKPSTGLIPSNTTNPIGPGYHGGINKTSPNASPNLAVAGDFSSLSLKCAIFIALFYWSIVIARTNSAMGGSGSFMGVSGSFLENFLAIVIMIAIFIGIIIPIALKMLGKQFSGCLWVGLGLAVVFCIGPITILGGVKNAYWLILISFSIPPPLINIYVTKKLETRYTNLKKIYAFLIPLAIVIIFYLFFLGVKNFNDIMVSDNYPKIAIETPKDLNQDSINDVMKNETKLIFLDELMPITKPENYHKNSWGSKAYVGDFKMNNKIYERGIGMFLSSSKIKGSGFDMLEYNLDGNYEILSFDLGADQNWCYGNDYGLYYIEIFRDGESAYKCDWRDYTYFDSLNIEVRNCKILTIKLSQKVGEKGTLNIIMGNAKLSY
jgi:serine/threonine protein kinase